MREEQGGAHNRVLGPDFQWRINDKETVTGQVLFSDTKTPDRPDLASEWNGQTLTGHAEYVWWTHSTKHIDWYTEAKNFSDGFRADNGFVPQVGYPVELRRGRLHVPADGVLQSHPHVRDRRVRLASGRIEALQPDLRPDSARTASSSRSRGFDTPTRTCAMATACLLATSCSITFSSPSAA